MIVNVKDRNGKITKITAMYFFCSILRKVKLLKVRSDHEMLQESLLQSSIINYLKKKLSQRRFLILKTQYF